jgi:hypothetical protein
MTSATKSPSANRKGIWITVLLLALVVAVFFIGTFVRHV